MKIYSAILVFAGVVFSTTTASMIHQKPFPGSSLAQSKAQAEAQSEGILDGIKKVVEKIIPKKKKKDPQTGEECDCEDWYYDCEEEDESWLNHLSTKVRENTLIWIKENGLQIGERWIIREEENCDKDGALVFRDIKALRQGKDKRYAMFPNSKTDL